MNTPNDGTTRAITASYTCAARDQNLMADATAGAIVVTLPPTNLEPGRIISVTKTDAGANGITFTANAGYTIETKLADTAINVQDDNITLMLGTGTVWYGYSDAEALVKLQVGTPGSAQTGNVNVSGTLVAGTGATITGAVSATTTVTAGTGLTVTTGTATISDGGVTATSDSALITMKSALDSGNKCTLGADGMTATVAAASPDGTKTARLTAANAGSTLAINGTQVVTAQGAAVANAAGGATVDAEARTALNALLARLRVHGLIAT